MLDSLLRCVDMPREGSILSLADVPATNPVIGEILERDQSRHGIMECCRTAHCTAASLGEAPKVLSRSASPSGDRRCRRPASSLLDLAGRWRRRGEEEGVGEWRPERGLHAGYKQTF
jgi:hypothetical protein